MGILLSCGCGASYDLKEEYAGKLVQCPKCNATLQVPGGAAQPLPSIPGMDPVFQRNKFLLRQKHLAIKEKYVVWDDEGKEILYIERPAYIFLNLLALFGGLFGAAILTVSLWMLASIVPHELRNIPRILGIAGFLPAWFALTIAMAPKRHVTFYRDSNKGEPLLQVLQDQKWAPLTLTYTVCQPDGSVLAKLSKNYIHNIFRKRWYIHAPDGSLWATAQEDSIILSLLRRFLGTFYGLLRTNFIIQRADSEDVLGEFNRKMTLLDRYVLDMTSDGSHQLDRRVAVALGVMLDTGERR